MLIREIDIWIPKYLYLVCTYLNYFFPRVGYSIELIYCKASIQFSFLFHLETKKMEEPTFSRFSKQNTKSFHKSGYCYDMIIILYKKSSATFTNFSNEKIIDHISLREKFWMMAREIRLDFCYLLLVLASFKNISKSVFIFKKRHFDSCIT